MARNTVYGVPFLDQKISSGKQNSLISSTEFGDRLEDRAFPVARAPS